MKIYSVLSGQLASVLSVPSSSSEGSVRKTKVSCLLLNPSNHLQLLVGSLDGLLRIWDYSEGKLLKTLDLGSPIQHACGHPTLLDQLFVALVAPKEKAQDSTLAGVYSISLKAKSSDTIVSPDVPRSPSRRMRLAQPRIVLALECSGSGKFLVSLNPQQINVCEISALQAGFAISLESEEKLTCIGFHPTENYFATGDESGRIRVWYGVLEGKNKGVEGRSTSLLHWHVHPVSSLRFTPNGAYLISGGEESVLVLWQLSTGTKEFIPRLGAPIKTISISNSPKQEQQIAVRLRDGTIHFIATKNLKISRSITDIKPGQ